MKKIFRRTAHSVYFVGIGGIGMSALARYFLRLGSNRRTNPKWSIAGMDAVESDITRELRKEGAHIDIGHKASNIGRDVGLVVYNRAITKDKPELAAARKAKIPIVPYARVLGEITRGHTTIAITGSHGKTTTTALAGMLLVKNNFDPTVFVGTKLTEFGGKNIRIGKSPYLVLEADDFGAAFLEYAPQVSIVTNIDREHMDFYKTFGNVQKAFLAFLSNTRDGGVLIVNRDDKPLYGLRGKIAALAKKKHLAVRWYSLNHAAAKKIKKVLKISGRHNLSNALAIYELGLLLKIPKPNILRSLGSYQGAWRRMERRGTLRGMRGVPVFDDYAHHPTEIKATLQAFHERFPRSPIICVFQPHQAKRLQALFKEFTAAFDDADALVLLPIYAVKGRDERAKYDSQKLATAVARRLPHKNVVYLPQPSGLKSKLASIAASFKQKPVIVMMGAGDIAALTENLI
ncbi:MAG TPA: UDP-N-acetylmuramate--L-alanine ligase [Candidatus Paceibacterota bacterium]|nr:UDP-N-acetylmuramate--L-alanine ligase [Candidatus Paceibacterota bacterium]